MVDFVWDVRNVIIRIAALEKGVIMDNLTVEQALEALLAHSKMIEETEKVPVLQAWGKVLAEDMVAELDNPPFDKSPIDGYACQIGRSCGSIRGTSDYVKGSGRD